MVQQSTFCHFCYILLHFVTAVTACYGNFLKSVTPESLMAKGIEPLCYGSYAIFENIYTYRKRIKPAKSGK